MARKEVDSVSETATQTERAAVVLGQGQFTQHKYSTILGYLHNYYVTVFGKNGLNEICVETFFSATHFETLKCIQNILNAF